MEVSISSFASGTLARASSSDSSLGTKKSSKSLPSSLPDAYHLVDAATASAALVTWLLKDGAGMLGRIGFAWAQGKDLDNNAKQWRLVADGCDDVARIV